MVAVIQGRLGGSAAGLSLLSGPPWHTLLAAELGKLEEAEKREVMAALGTYNTNQHFAILYGNSANWTGPVSCLAPYCGPFDVPKPYSVPVIASQNREPRPPRVQRPRSVPAPRQFTCGPRWPQRGYRGR